MNNSFSRSAAASALLFACVPAQALEYKLISQYTASRTDNVGRVSEGSGLVQSDIIHRPSLRALLNQETGRVRVTADYFAEYRIYTEDVFDDRFRWTGRADLQWDAIPEFLQFNATNSRTETTEDSLLQNVENNRQVTSVTSIGPKLFYRPRPSDAISLEYRFSDINQGQVDTANVVGQQALQGIQTDSQRQLFAAAYELGLSANRSLTAEFTRDNVDFEQNAPELEIDTASLIYKSKGDALELEARAGYTTIDRDLGRNTVNGIIGRLNVDWQISGSGKIQLTASRNINDQSDSVLRGSADFGQGAVFSNSDVNEVFEEHAVRVSYTHAWGRNIATFGYNFQDQNFEDSAFAPGESRDEQQNGFSAFYSRRLTPRARVRFNAQFLQREFASRGVDEDTFGADFRFDYRAGRTLNLFFGANYEEREAVGTSPLVDQLSFDEFVYFVGLSFDLVDRYKSTQQR